MKVGRCMFFLLVNILFLLTAIPVFSETDMSNYCAIPPFVGGAIEPNILVVLDRSGSMTWAAYNPNTDRTGVCGYNDDCGWTYTGEEEGYFDPKKIYKYDSTNQTWMEVGEWPTTKPNMPSQCGFKESTTNPEDKCPAKRQCIGDFMSENYTYKGSCLNFHLMRRIDVARWALTGGRPRGCGSLTDADCDPDIRCVGQDYCDLDLYSDYYGYVRVPKTRINGLAQQMAGLAVRPRAGVIFFSGNGVYSHKVFIGDYPDGGNADPDHPYTYFKRYINYVDAYGATPSGPAMWEAWDYFSQSDDHSYGGFDDDDIAPGTYKDPLYKCDHEGGNCRLFWCAKNFVILISDGQFNTPDCDIRVGFEDNSADPVVPAHKMHTEALRTLTDGSGGSHDVKVDKVYTIGVFLGGTGEHSLKNVAMYGSFDPAVAGGNWPGGTSGYPMDECGPIDDCCDGDECGAGSPCTPLPTSHPDWDEDGDGEPDAFFSAKNASQLKEALESILMDIVRRVSSGTSVSVLAAESDYGANLLQAVFYPQKVFGSHKVDWIGYLYNWWVHRGWSLNATNIREDTDENKKLTRPDDYVTVFEFDTAQNELLITRYKDNNGDGVPDQYVDSVILDELRPLWEAGKKLSETQPDDRKIYANVGGNWTAFEVDNWLEISHYLGAEYSGNQTATERLIRYIRGEEVAGFRPRSTGSFIWRLGDIIFSTPEIVDYPEYSVVFVGANDGMLHAFRFGYLDTTVDKAVARLQNSRDDTGYDKLGEELWAFVPQSVLPYLRYLAHPDYPHLYYVDLSPFVIEADYDKDGKRNKVLIGGMRLGGAVGCSEPEVCVNPPSDTCPDPSDNTTNCVGLSSYFALDITDPLDPKLMWEFSDSGLGFSYSGPAVVKKDEDYYVIFLSGPTDYSGNSGQNLKVFVLDLETGNKLTTIDTGKSRAFGGRMFVYDKDNEIYFGYVQEGSWKGGVLKLDTSSWEVIPVVENIGPVTVWIVEHSLGGEKWLFFGEGRYFYKEDDLAEERYLYGVRADMCEEEGGCTRNHLGDVTDVAGTATPYGWYIKLEPQTGDWGAERLISNPAFWQRSYASGEVYFTTMQPNADPCEFGGRTFAWRVEAGTGGPVTHDMPATVLIQLSTGQILELKEKEKWVLAGDRKTQGYHGLPTEQGPRLLDPLRGWKGSVIQWIER